MTLPRRPSPEALLMIGEVVRRTGKAASTIRYYEEIGLITPPERISGRRHYPAGIVRELAVAMRGDVRVASSTAGTEFTISLPRPDDLHAFTQS